MHLLNLTLGQFFVLLGGVSALMIALYLLDRSRHRQVVATLRFWLAAEQPSVITRRKRIQQPLSLVLQLVSMALLLLAIAQLRWGSLAGVPRDHVVILETSAWMAARAGDRTLMEAARERARSYVRAVPARDRIMLVRADALTTPATAFEPDRGKLVEAIDASAPGATALNLDQALAFAHRIQGQSGRRMGEVVFVGSGRIGESDALERTAPPARGFRALMVPDAVENRGLRKIGLRRSASDPDLWEIYVAVRNYGTAPQTVTLALSFGASKDGAGSTPVGARRLNLQPGTERETTFEYRTRAAGLLDATLIPPDGFPEDDHAALELPAQPTLPVTVYSDEPDLLRPVLSSSARVNATYRKPSEYRAAGDGDLVILDRFRPPARPTVNSIWIDPPSDGSPIPIREQPTDVPFTHWASSNPLGAGLRTKDFRLASASVFETSPTDIRIGEVAAGPVVVARPEKPKIVVLGFHPTLSAMRYELAAPLLFANILRWMDPEIFRRWELSGGSVGTVKMVLDGEERPADVRVTQENGRPVPFTLRDRTLRFFAGAPGTVRVVAGDREYVHSLMLPQLWESKWEPPAAARRGIPRANPLGDRSLELWHWLALAGACGLLAEWFLFGRFSRSARRRRAVVAMEAAAPRARVGSVS